MDVYNKWNSFESNICLCSPFLLNCQFKYTLYDKPGVSQTQTLVGDYYRPSPSVLCLIVLHSYELQVQSVTCLPSLLCPGCS